MNDIMNIQGIECYEKDGCAYLKLEAVARGLGFTKTENKNGTEYTTIRWERVFGFLDEIGFRPQVGERRLHTGKCLLSVSYESEK